MVNSSIARVCSCQAFSPFAVRKSFLQLASQYDIIRRTRLYPRELVSVHIDSQRHVPSVAVLVATRSHSLCCRRVLEPMRQGKNMVPAKPALGSRIRQIIQTIVRAAIDRWQSDCKQRGIHVDISLPDLRKDYLIEKVLGARYRQY